MLFSYSIPCIASARRLSTVAAITAAISLGGCASTGQQILDFASTKPGASNVPAATPGTVSELDRAIAYWQEKYAKDPRDLKAALSLAQNLKAKGDKRGAYAILQQASFLHSKSRELASEYGRLALEFNQLQLAARLLEHAYDPLKPDWRVLSAQGALLGKQGNLPLAIGAFEKARKIAPNETSITNNLAMTHLAAGNLDNAEALLREIAFAPDAKPRMRQNLALVLGLQGKMTEAKALAAQDGDPAKAYARIEKIARMRAAGKRLRRGQQPSQRRSSGSYASASTRLR